jgi:sarcosine oxidase
VQRAFKLWRNLEQESRQQLLTMTGGIYIGLPGSEIVTGVLLSAREHHLTCDYLTASEVMARFPGFRVPDSMVGVYEENGGVLDAQACVDAHLDLAARAGADLHHSEPVLRWSPDGEGVQVETGTATYRAARLVIAAGSWIPDLLAELSLPLVVWRVVVAYFNPAGSLFDAGSFPFYLLEVPEGTFYGLPNLPGQGLKTGRHDTGEVCTPQTIRRTVDDREIDQIRSMLDIYMPGAAATLKEISTCIYTMTPDEDFIIDRHPEHHQVAYVSACSGHGFKFSAAIGEALAQLSLEGIVSPLIAPFSASRFGAGMS